MAEVMNESVTNLKERDDNVFLKTWLPYYFICEKKKIEKFTKIPEVPIFGNKFTQSFFKTGNFLNWMNYTILSGKGCKR